MKHEFSQHIFEKYTNTNFHENLNSGSLVVPFGVAKGWTDGRTDGRIDRMTDMTQLTVAIRNSVNAPNNSSTTERSI